MNPSKFRLGILLDSYQIPAWIYRSIERVINLNSVEFSLIIFNENTHVQFKNSKILNNTRTIVYKIFNTLDEKIFNQVQNSLEIMNAKKLLSGVPVIKVKPINKEGNNYIKPSDIEKIRGYGVDILVRIGFDPLFGEILTASKYGVWAYRFEGDPNGFWEVVNGQPETRSDLIVLNEEINGGRTIYSSSSFTYPFSPARNKNRTLWKSSSFLPRQIALLYLLGEKKFIAETEKYRKVGSLRVQKGSKTPPSNLLSMWLIGRLLTRIVREMFFRIFFLDEWFLMFALGPNGSIPFKDFKKIVPPKDKFWADPHITQVNGTYYIFIEEYLREKNKGHISVIELDELGNWKAPIKVLEKEYHLSYPFIFEWNDKFYMVPETRANKTIDLYECSEFPYKWNFKQCLMENVSAVDTTLVHHSNKWWLFTAMAENEAAGPNVELFLFYTDDLFSGEWKAHTKNPIISDVKSARPAGSLYMNEGKLFRPSQDCSKTYGYGFDLNEIEVLSETEYCERKTLSITPNWDKRVLATHTFGICGNLTVIDACSRIQKF
jgi:hypothetical protein